MKHQFSTGDKISAVNHAIWRVIWRVVCQTGGSRHSAANVSNEHAKNFRSLFQRNQFGFDLGNFQTKLSKGLPAVQDCGSEIMRHEEELNASPLKIKRLLEGEVFNDA